MKRLETDEELYRRINKAYGMWGAFLSVASEARGEALDECAAYVKLKREMVDIAPTAPRAQGDER